VALLGCVPSFVASVGDAVDSSGDWLAELGIGLNEAAAAARGVSGPIKTVSGVLEVGVDVAEDAVSLLAPGEWPGLLTALDALSINLLALKNPVAPTSAPSTGGTAP
jgi:hypothetical protein